MFGFDFFLALVLILICIRLYNRTEWKNKEILLLIWDKIRSKLGNHSTSRSSSHGNNYRDLMVDLTDEQVVMVEGNTCITTARLPESNKLVAIKKIQNIEQQHNVIKRIMSQRPHQFICHVYGISPSSVSYSIVVDHVPQNLWNFVVFLKQQSDENSQHFRWGELIRLAHQISCGLSFLYNEANIPHGRLQCKSVLLDDQHNVKLSDYGSLFPSSSSDADYVAWTAPEILSNDRVVSEKTDVYSFGVTLWEMIAARRPFEGKLNLKTLVCQGNREEMPDDEFPPPVQQVIDGCWDRNLVKRPMISKIEKQMMSLRRHIDSGEVPDSSLFRMETATATATGPPQSPWDIPQGPPPDFNDPHPVTPVTIHQQLVTACAGTKSGTTQALMSVIIPVVGAFLVREHEDDQVLRNVGKLLDLNADVNARAYGLTPLTNAVKHGHIRISTLLIQRGANVNLFDASGNSPLLVAIDKKYRNIVELLLTNGADPNAVQPGTRRTALIVASKAASEDFVDLLLVHGCETEVKDADGYNAYTMAAYFMQDCTNRLQENNARPVDQTFTQSVKESARQSITSQFESYRRIVGKLEDVTQDKVVPVGRPPRGNGNGCVIM